MKDGFRNYSTISIIDIVFTVKNLATNDRLQNNFLTMISSLFEHTSIENLRLHVIGDSDSHLIVDKTLRKRKIVYGIEQVGFTHSVITGKTIYPGRGFVVEGPEVSEVYNR